MDETKVELLQEQSEAWRAVFRLCEELGMETNVYGKSGLELVTEFIQRNAAQHGVHPTPLTLFGMRVEIANWLNLGQWFIRPLRRR